MKRLLKATFLFALNVSLLSAVFITASAQQGRERSTKKARAAAEQSAKAARVFDQIMATAEISSGDLQIALNDVLRWP